MGPGVGKEKHYLWTTGKWAWIGERGTRPREEANAAAARWDHRVGGVCVRAAAWRVGRGFDCVQDAGHRRRLAAASSTGFCEPGHLGLYWVGIRVIQHRGNTRSPPGPSAWVRCGRRKG